jgi:hypothetical protein
MNRRTLLATTPLALVPRLPGRSPSDTEAADDDPPSVEEFLPGADILPTGWIPGSPDSSLVGRRDDDPPSTVRGVKPRQHPQTDASLSPAYAERRFVTDSDLPSVFEYIDVALEVARVDERATHDSRPRAVRALHEVTVADETENWELLSTGWVDIDIRRAANWLREPSVATVRKPQCAVPDDIDLSTDRPMIEMAVAVTPLPWGTVVVTGTLVDPDDAGRARRLATRVASRTAEAVRDRPLPLEARQ